METPAASLASMSGQSGNNLLVLRAMGSSWRASLRFDNAPDAHCVFTLLPFRYPSVALLYPGCYLVVAYVLSLAEFGLH